MAEILNDHDFKHAFHKKIEAFYQEFEEANINMVTTVSNKYVDQAMKITEENSGILGPSKGIDEQTQQMFLMQAMAECDQTSIEIFQRLSEKYHRQLKDEMEEIMFKSLLMNL